MNWGEYNPVSSEYSREFRRKWGGQQQMLAMLVHVGVAEADRLANDPLGRKDNTHEDLVKEFRLDYPRREILLGRLQQALAELNWLSSHRPYYLVYPSVMRMSQRIPGTLPAMFPKLHDLRKDTGGVGQATVLLRFPKGHEWDRLESVLLSITEYEGGSAAITIILDYGGFRARIENAFDGKFDETIDDVIAEKATGGSWSNSEAAADVAPAAKKALRLIFALSMLEEHGTGLLQRDVLTADVGKPVTDAILNRATKRKGLGFTLGQDLEKKSRAEHTRDPHWSVRWMRPVEGEEPVKRGLVPRWRPVKGSVVKASGGSSVKLDQIPTGFMPYPKITPKT